MMTNEELQSKTIGFLRFPLIVGVVLIHSYFNEVVINGVDLMADGHFPIYTQVSYLFSEILSRIAVPLFFFISGFLFFYKVSAFTKSVYFQKLKKRVRTILVPYVLWNLLVALLFFLTQSCFPELTSGRNKLICDYGISDWLWTFWNTNMINPSITRDGGAYPICYQFWFIRDLMVVMIFSPLVYFLVKRLRHYAVLCLGMLWLFGWWFDVVGFSSDASFFFSAGAYFSIHRKNFVEAMKPFWGVSAILYVLTTVMELCLKEVSWYSYLHQIGILIGIVAIVTLSAHLLRKGTWHTNAFLSDSSFFIYAYHAMPLAFSVKLLFKMIQPHTDGMLLALYVVCPLVTILIGLLLYYLLRKFLPQLTSVLTGGR